MKAGKEGKVRIGIIFAIIWVVCCALATIVVLKMMDFHVRLAPLIVAAVISTLGALFTIIYMIIMGAKKSTIEKDAGE